MLIKVCGMRQSENIRAVEATGPDWMGFIFHPRSPRYVAAAPTYLPQRCRRVGVFVNAPAAEINRQVATFSLDLVQLHGDETPAQCAALRRQGLRIIRALRIATADDARRATDYAESADYLLFDTPSAAYGGSGLRFDWACLDAYDGPLPFLLSGGIGMDALPALRHFHHPRCAGLDLNSRFETAPALKDAAALKDFIQSARLLNLSQTL